MTRGRGWRSAIRTVYKGIEYASRLEADYAQQLDLRKREGTVKSWERQVRFPLVVNGKTVCSMIIDFKVVKPNGDIEFHETKGWATAVWRLKAKLLAALHPDLTYVVIGKNCGPFIKDAYYMGGLSLRAPRKARTPSAPRGRVKARQALR